MQSGNQRDPLAGLSPSHLESVAEWIKMAHMNHSPSAESITSGQWNLAGQKMIVANEIVSGLMARAAALRRTP